VIGISEAGADIADAEDLCIDDRERHGTSDVNAAIHTGSVLLEP